MTDTRKKIRQLIERKKTNVAKTARRADINSSILYNYLNGKTEISTKTLDKVLHALE